MQPLEAGVPPWKRLRLYLEARRISFLGEFEVVFLRHFQNTPSIYWLSPDTVSNDGASRSALLGGFQIHEALPSFCAGGIVFQSR